MRLLLTGGNGQLGRAVRAQCGDQVQVLAPDRSELDMAQPATLASYVMAHRPTHILHAAAWTAVDAAEEDAAAARTVNVDATVALANAAHVLSIPMLYVSTDFVFGRGHDRPIPTDASTAPLSVYGLTKRDGEEAVRNICGENGIIVRTSWVYDADGKNFVNTMLRLMTEREELRVVADQIGAPTWAGNLASVCLSLLRHEQAGIWHYSDAGVASWYDFAVAIYEEARTLGLLDPQKNVRILPIATEAYPTPAERPRYSVLDRSKTWAQVDMEITHWRVALRKVLSGDGRHD